MVCSKVKDLNVGVVNCWIDEAVNRVIGKSTLQAQDTTSATPGEVNFLLYLKYCSIAKKRCSAEVQSPLHCWSCVRVERSWWVVAIGGSSATLRSDFKWSAISLFEAVSKGAAANDTQTSSFIELENAGSVKKSLKAGDTIQQKHQSTLKQRYLFIYNYICHGATKTCNILHCNTVHNKTGQYTILIGC